MKLQFTFRDKKGNLMNKLSLILFGTFTTSIIFAISMKYLGQYGVYLSLLICIILIFCGFYYIEKDTRLRLITWGILGTITLIIAAYTIILTVLSKSLEGF